MNIHETVIANKKLQTVTDNKFCLYARQKADKLENSNNVQVLYVD